MTNKPPYQVMSMAEIRKLPANGFNAISTFSGCGGSSLGYRMAGFKVLYANEFHKAARDSYSPNKAAYTVLDSRNIRNVSGRDILKIINLDVGELDLFDGSPPCVAFSTAGIRNKGWNKVRKYSHTKQRDDDLFFEYSRLVKEIQPKVFVAENVSGLVKGVSKGYFLNILKELKQCGYRVSAKLLDASWLGVPQKRERIFFIGVRNDLNIDPCFPKPLPYQYTVRDAIPWILRQNKSKSFYQDELESTEKPSQTIGTSTSFVSERFKQNIVEVDNRQFRKLAPSHLRIYNELGIGECHKKRFSHVKLPIDKPSNTITTGLDKYHPLEKRYMTIDELKRICSFPDDFVLAGSYAQQVERLGRSVPPVMMMHIAKTVRDEVLKCAAS